ncbi:MAG: DUF2889 domain-containing protein [Ignavibacteriales bacterium]
MYSKSWSVDVEMVQFVGYRTTGTFEDFYHSLKVTLLFELGSGKILEADATIIRVPFKECELGISSITKLIGLEINSLKGVSKKVFELLAGTAGCTHLAELVIESIKARVQAFGQERPDWVPEDILDKRLKEYENKFANTCIHYTSPYWKPYEEI